MVTEKDYPDDVAPTFLRQITAALYEHCNEFRRDPKSNDTMQAFTTKASELKRHIYEIHNKFKDTHSFDKTTQALSAIERATGAMQQNIGSMLGNRTQMFEIEGKSTGLRDTASRFRHNS